MDKYESAQPFHKATLQLHLPKQGEELPNTKAGHARLIKVLQAAVQPVQLICEASGGYERPVLAALAAAGVPYTLLNARQARDFAKACGTRAKTDKIDAEVLAASGTALQPSPTRPPTVAERALQEHVRCRQRLLELLINLRLQAASLTLQALQRVVQAAIRALEKQLKALKA
jgi:transposase